MSHHTLQRSIEETHQVLSTRLDRAKHASPTTESPRDRFPAIDTFLASTSRHVAGAVDVLVPASRRELASGAAAPGAFVDSVRRLEAALAQVKAKLYGEAHAIHRPWPELWAAVDDAYAAMWRHEEALVGLLVDGTSDDTADAIARSLHRAELRAPTRPHPHVPHVGLPGRVARRVARRVDQFWDAAEGRMVPEPVRPKDRDSHGRFRQYLLADPHLPED